MKEYSMQITMHCPICGNDQFELIDTQYMDLIDAPDETEVLCSDCKHILSKRELIDENQEAINANIEDIKQEVVKDFRRKLKETLRRRR